MDTPLKWMRLKIQKPSGTLSLHKNHRFCAQNVCQTLGKCESQLVPRCHCPINEGGVRCVDCWLRMRKRVPFPLFRICALRQPGFLLCSGGGGRSGPPFRGGFMAVSSSTPSAALD